jgi:thiol:disulfide interchange protein
VRKILLLIIISLFFFNQSFADKVVRVPESELKQTSKNIENLVKRDSLNNLIIQELKNKLEGKESNLNSTTDSVKIVPSVGDTERSSNAEESFGWYLLTAIGLGLLALLMPCVFPIIPMTVTYFLKNSKSRKDGLIKAFTYGVSIVIIYTSLAVIPALFIGEDFAIELSSNWVINGLFFVVFIIFGLSFLGMFEITLPARFVNKVDTLSDKGGLLGIFFMAFTLVLVSFSCTVPFVSQVIIEVANGGSRWRPVAGMLAYSITFAIPFVLFAIFPTWLKSLPKSGSWMTVLKVVLGFIEIGFAFKFLSALDLSYGLNLLPRDVFISIWIALAFVLGLYLLGKIVLPHDDEVKRLGVPRLMVAILSFTFGIYLIPGLFGAPLNFLSAILPPADYHTFNLKEIIREDVKGMDGEKSVSTALPEVPLYSHELKLPHGLNGYFDYHQAIRVAKILNKPIFIDFTGKNCGNCRKMENAVWVEPSVLAILKEDYLVVALYADARKIDLPESENYIGSNGEKITKLYKKNLDIEFSKFGDVAQPFYVLLNPYTEAKLVQKSIGYEPDAEKFVQYLEEGKKNFNSYKK